MAVERIEEYRQKDGTDVLKVILKPTSKFPDGYFYCDAEDIDIVKQATWFLVNKRKTSYVRCHDSTACYFQSKMSVKKLGYMADYIDHQDCVGFDNCDKNLFAVYNATNLQNIMIKGYSFRFGCKRKYRYWEIHIGLDYTTYRETVTNELSACIVRYRLEQENYSNPYNFLVDRLQSLDLLDLERTGQISSEEAIYRHVMKYADNAWYYYRYGLEQYFKDNNIPVPAYSIDEQGFMIHPITGQKLCPL